MPKLNDSADTGRRSFLKLATVAAPAVVMAAAAPATEADAAAPETATGLQDTAHIRAYYQSARF